MAHEHNSMYAAILAGEQLCGTSGFLCVAQWLLHLPARPAEHLEGRQILSSSAGGSYGVQNTSRKTLPPLWWAWTISR